MVMIKNAFKNVFRFKGRNILIGLIAASITVTCCIALSIKNTADSIVQQFKETNDFTAAIALNKQKLLEDAQKNGERETDLYTRIKRLTSQDIEQYGSSEYVRSYSYSLTVDLGSYVLQPVSNAERLREQMAETGDSLVAMGNQNIYNVTGYNDLAKLPEFQNGSWQLLKGEFPASNDIVLKCIVSEKLANANQAEIGSTIVFVNPYNTDEQFTFIVSGIYTDSAQISNNDLVVGGTADFSDRILVNYRSLKELVNSSQNNPDNVQSHTGQTISTRLSGRLSSRFILYSAQDLEAFEQQLHDKGLDAYYTLQTNADELQQSYKPLYSLRHYAITFLGIILLGGLVILIILNILHVRERKYEIGILRAIGMKKTQICLQFLMELLLVSILSILVGFGIGVTLSGPISNTLLENEMTAQQSDPGLADAQSSDYSFVINNEQSADYLDGEQSISQIYHIDTQVDFWFFLQIASIGLLMVLLSSLFSILLISRYEPLKILNNRL